MLTFIFKFKFITKWKTRIGCLHSWGKVLVRIVQLRFDLLFAIQKPKMMS